MKPSQVSKALAHLIERNRPAFVWGPPGAGKSDVVAAVAKSLKLELRDIRLSLMDPTDLKGFPIIKGTAMHFAPPSFLPTKGKGLLFLDEMNSSPQSVQAAAYQLILNRRLGDYTLPLGWSIVAAGNRTTDRAVVHAQPSALANRFVHIDFDVDVDDWYDWAGANGISDITRAFIKFRPELLHNFDATSNPRSFPTPRSWVFVDNIVKSNLDLTTEYELITGTVGEGAATEYISFSKLAMELPTAEEILLSPDSAPVPDSPAGQYAVTAMMESHTTVNSLNQVMTYMERLPVEFQVLSFRNALKDPSKRTLLANRRFIDWTQKNRVYFS